ARAQLVRRSSLLPPSVGRRSLFPAPGRRSSSQRALIFPASAICFVLFRPLSKNLYRRVNKEVAELLWLQLIWLIDWWGGIK
ncbi:hypothetical protein ACLOJK_024979, partial [Asimina triloba]